MPDDDATAIRHFFNDVFPKEDVKRVLVHEQHGICATCMRRIHEDANTRVEHIYPLSKDKQRAIKYSNMLAVCDGGEKTPGIQGRVLCCDANKKDTEIFLNPLDKDQMRKIAYKRDGTIYTDPRDEKMEKDIKDVLRLNGIQNENGTFHDTSTEIVKGRRDTYQNARKRLTC